MNGRPSTSKSWGANSMYPHGSCDWVCLFGGVWFKTADNCEPGYECFEPTHRGAIDDTWTTDCNLDG